jgi:hypothetical protein
MNETDKKASSFSVGNLINKFACDGKWYQGRIAEKKERNGTALYLVKFTDGSEEYVTGYGMRLARG